MKSAGYLVAGSLLLILADFMPKTAIGIASALLLGTILTSPEELQSVANYIKNNTGAK